MAGATGLSQVVVAVMYVYTARTLTPSIFGMLVVAISAGNAMVGVVDFGTNSYWVRELSRGVLTISEVSKRIFWKLVSVSALTGLWAASSWLLLPESKLWIIGPVCLATLVTQTMQSRLRAMARGELIAIVVISDRMFAATAMCVLYYLGLSPSNALWISLVLGSIFGALIANWLANRVRRVRFNIFPPVLPWKGAKNYGFTNLAASGRGFDVTVLSFFAGPSAAGFYGAVSRWTQPIGLMVNAFSSASAPYVAQATSWQVAWKHLRSAAWLPICSVLATLPVFGMAPMIVSIVLGEEYRASVPVLQILALATIPAIVNQPLEVFLMSRGFDRLISRIMVLTTVLYLGAVAVLASQSGAVGAAIALMVAQLVLLVSLLIAARWTKGREAYSEYRTVELEREHG